MIDFEILKTIIRRIELALAYEDRDAIHARLIAEGVSEEDFFLAWCAARTGAQP